MKPDSKTKFGPVHLSMLNCAIRFAFDPANLAITQSVPAFNDVMQILRNKYNSINQIKSTIALSITGFTRKKQNQKFALADKSIVMMDAVYSYAIAINNFVLAAQMKTCRSTLYKMSPVSLVSLTTGALNTTRTLVPSLSEYNISTGSVDEWQSILDEYKNSVTTPRNAIAERKALNMAWKSLLKECMLIIYNRADKLAPMYREHETIYYNTYLAVRKLRPAGHISTQLRAHVLSELDKPVMNAQVLIEGTELTTASDENGYALINHIPYGNHTVTIVYDDTTRTYGPFHFKKGKSLTHYFTIGQSMTQKTEATANC